MYKIVNKRNLAENIFELTIDAPHVAKKVKAGQFLIIRINEKGERIPLTFCKWDVGKGTISIAFLVVGKTTKHLSTLEVGDFIQDVVGPLGTPTHIEKTGNVVCIAGGIGSAEVLPVAKAFKEAGNTVTVIEGAKNKDLLIYEDELDKAADRFLVATDDGSKGFHGFGIDVLKDLIVKEKIDLVHVVGPTIMMKAVSEFTKISNIKTIASLNPIMLDGSGMCGVCRVEVGGKTVFGCVDGPEFDAHLVNWDLLISRQKMYLEQEKQSYQSFLEKQKDCDCLEKVSS